MRCEKARLTAFISGIDRPCAKPRRHALAFHVLSLPVLALFLSAMLYQLCTDQR